MYVSDHVSEVFIVSSCLVGASLDIVNGETNSFCP